MRTRLTAALLAALLAAGCTGADNPTPPPTPGSASSAGEQGADGDLHKKLEAIDGVKSAKGTYGQVLLELDRPLTAEDQPLLDEIFTTFRDSSPELSQSLKARSEGVEAIFVPNATEAPQAAWIDRIKDRPDVARLEITAYVARAVLESGTDPFAWMADLAKDGDHEGWTFLSAVADDQTSVEGGAGIDFSRPGSVERYLKTVDAMGAAGAEPVLVSTNLRCKVADEAMALKLAKELLPILGERDSIDMQGPGGASWSGTPQDIIAMFEDSNGVGDAVEQAGGAVTRQLEDMKYIELSAPDDAVAERLVDLVTSDKWELGGDWQVAISTAGQNGRTSLTPEQWRNAGSLYVASLAEGGFDLNIHGSGPDVETDAAFAVSPVAVFEKNQAQFFTWLRKQQWDGAAQLRLHGKESNINFLTTPRGKAQKAFATSNEGAITKLPEIPAEGQAAIKAWDATATE